LEEGIRENLCDLRLNKEFSEMIPKAQSIKEKIDKLDLIEIKGFCYVKATVKRLIIQATDGEYLHITYAIKDFSQEYIKNCQSSTP